MKKLILIIATFISAASRSGAQEVVVPHDDRRDFTFGLKLGTNYANVYDTKGSDFQADPKFGWVAGAFIGIPIGTYFGIQPELLFSQKGFQGSGSTFAGRYEFTRTTEYIDIPLFITFKPSPLISLMAGPQYSYLMRQKDVFVSSAISLEQSDDFKNDNIRKNILCFIGGFDVNLQHVVLSGRAGWDIQNNNGDGSSTNPRYKNVWYQATMGFRF